MDQSVKLSYGAAIATSLASIAVVAWSISAESRPYPDRSGICYFYRGDIQELLESCVISSGYGAGAHYATLHWPDGVDTHITLINACSTEHFDDRGFCRYIVDDYEAVLYERDVFLNITMVEDPDNLTCYRIVETDNSVCYRFNE